MSKADLKAALGAAKAERDAVREQFEALEAAVVALERAVNGGAGGHPVIPAKGRKATPEQKAKMREAWTKRKAKAAAEAARTAADALTTAVEG